MKTFQRREFLRRITATFGSMAVVGCGGGATGTSDAAAAEGDSAPTPASPVAQPPDATPSAPAPTPKGAMRFALVSPIASSAAPFCIGYAFRKGDVPAGSSVAADIAHLQVTPKNFWSDGSLKVAVVAGRAPLSADMPLTVSLSTAAAGHSSAALSLDDLRATGASAAIECGAFGMATWSGVDWDDPFKDWIAGPEMSSWIYRKPVGTDAHLVAWLEVRLFAGGAVEILPWIENGYLNVAGPTSKSATYAFLLGGTQRFSAAIDLPSHCRTPLVSGATLSHWLGVDPQTTPKHDTIYMQRTALVPAYRASVSPAADAVKNLPSTYAPLQQGRYPGSMGSGGYHSSIGLLPEWDVLYLTSTAPSTYGAVIRQAFSAGRYPSHYRDETTNRPPLFSAYPKLVTANSGASTEGIYAPFAAGTGAPRWARSHHPSVGYMAYLLSGWHFFLEELQFATIFNHFYQPNAARHDAKGIFLTNAGANTTRGAAWCCRTLFQACTVTPENDPLYPEMLAAAANNIEYMHTRYVARAHNPFGFVTPYSDYTGHDAVVQTGATASDIPINVNGAADDFYVGWTLTIGGETRTIVDFTSSPEVVIVDAPFSTAPTQGVIGRMRDGLQLDAAWMQDFYTAAIGYGISLDLDLDADVKVKHVAFFEWKAKSIVGRLGGIGVDEYLYRDAAVYTITVAPTDSADWSTGSGPWHTNWGEIYKDTYGSENPGQKGELRGAYFPSGTSYWGNLQPAIAYAVEHKVAGALVAYQRMTSAPNWPQLVNDFDRNPVWGIRPTE